MALAAPPPDIPQPRTAGGCALEVAATAVRHLLDDPHPPAAGLPHRRPPRARRWELDAAIIELVAAGCWSPAHEALARRTGFDARAAAYRLAGRSQRRAVAETLEQAALVVITDTCGCPLPAHLRAEIVSSWSVPDPS